MKLCLKPPSNGEKLLVRVRVIYCNFVYIVLVSWTPVVISDLVNGGNKFGTDWKRIRMEYNFTATVEALKIKWHHVKQQEYITLEDGK